MVILGAGRHTIDLLTTIDNPCEKSLIFFDDVTAKVSRFLNKFKVINNLKELEKIIEQDNEFVIGTGGTKTRRALYEKTKYLNPNYRSVVSSTAIIGNINVELGWGLNIMHQVFISNNVSIGNGTLINRLAGIHHDVRIGCFCEIAPGANILGGVVIGDNTLIGAGATILQNVTICDDVIVGAGATVTKDINTKGVYVGVPAKNILSEKPHTTF